MKPMTGSMLVAKIANTVGITTMQARNLVASLVDLAAHEAINGFTLPGLGTISLVQEKTRFTRKLVSQRRSGRDTKSFLIFRADQTNPEFCKRASEELTQNEKMIRSAIEIIKQAGKGSTSLLQKKLRIGYTYAARLMDILEERGVIDHAGAYRCDAYPTIAANLLP